MPSTTMQDGTPLRPTQVDGSESAYRPLSAAPALEEAAPPAANTATVVPVGVAQLRPAGALGTRQQIQDELDQMAFAIRSFGLKQPDQVLREVGAYSARLTEMAVLLHRVENVDRQYTRVRTQQVDRWQHELELQFKIASRLIEVQRQDIALMGGMT